MSENRWKVLLLVAASVAAVEPSRALSLVQRPRSTPMFVPKSYFKRRARQSRVLFLDDDENRQPFGRGEIDLTNSKIKFDDSPDYEFTSPDDSKVKEDDSGTERFYEPPRVRYHPKYYQGRFGRYAPNFGLDPYVFPSRNSFYSSGWKARSPRVVFPYAADGSNSVQTNSHAGPVDSVVFREQNFGLNDIGAEDQTLQDIGTGSADAFAERDAYDPLRALYDIRLKRRKKLLKPMFVQTNTMLPQKRFDYEHPNTTVLPAFKPISDAQMARITDILKEMSTNANKVPDYSTNSKRKGKLLHIDNELDGNQNFEAVTEAVKDRQDEKDCSQGGTCEFFFYCWLVGGLLEGSCGVLKGCCHRVAKAGILGVHDSNSIEYTSNEINYGPVINDDSK